MSRGRGLRLSGGELRGRRLRVAPGVRPTEARLREALFDRWGQRVRDARFLDLFAGSGAIGLEALSRGARQALFLESGPKVLPVLRENLSLAPAGARWLRSELPRALGRLRGERYDLVFADPPYAFTEFDPLLRQIEPLLAEDGELVLEHSVRAVVPERVEALVLGDQRRYGESCLSFYVLSRAPGE